MFRKLITAPPTKAIVESQDSLNAATCKAVIKYTRKIEYDAIPLEYKASKELPYRAFESASFMFQVSQAVSEAQVRGSSSENAMAAGIKILELGCGEGHYSRKMKEAFKPAHLTSIDLSSQMVGLAKRQIHGDTIEYMVQNCMTLPQLNSKNGDPFYDVCAAAYILCYATTEDELVQFLDSVYKNLKPGGTFVTITDNIFDDPVLYGKHTQECGLVKVLNAPQRVDGTAMTLVFTQVDKNDDGSLKFSELCRATDWWLSPEVYDRAFLKVGFSAWEWIKLPVSGMHAFDCNPPIIMLKATK
ncbi:hypothetical protein HDU79_007606 [Rhizoclosmatium sp. JEL0117]|nr:hypothetical protein HDU79_007606 [Rhizoclosmatium sp. JEL0117]